MERLKKILSKLLFPPIWLVILNIPIAAALLVYTFAYQHEEEPFAYASYFLSAYVLTIVCARIPKLIKSGFAVAHQNRYMNRYLTDVFFRMHVSLYLSLGINLLYAAMKLFFGVYYRSVWFGTLAVYYFLLAVMRFLLLRHVNRNPIGKAFVSEMKRYRLCGVILVLMNIALSGVVVLVVYQNKGFEYAGYLIYIMAMYAFYAIITAVMDVIKYRKYRSPVMSAAKAIKLAAALVSMLSLETAMLAQFDNQSNPVFFRRIMVASTGGAVCLLILAMAVFMIFRSTKELKKLRNVSLNRSVGTSEHQC